MENLNVISCEFEKGNAMMCFVFGLLIGIVIISIICLIVSIFKEDIWFLIISALVLVLSIIASIIISPKAKFDHCIYKVDAGVVNIQDFSDQYDNLFDNFKVTDYKDGIITFEVSSKREVSNTRIR